MKESQDITSCGHNFCSYSHFGKFHPGYVLCYFCV